MLNQEFKDFLDNLFQTSSLNRLPGEYSGGLIFDTPLIGAARADDPIYGRYQKLVGPKHLTPGEMWAANNEAAVSLSELFTVSIVFPFTDAIRQPSRKAETMPEEIYMAGRNYANAFMGEVIKQSKNFFIDLGYRAASGMQSPVFNIYADEETSQVYSSWSERHIAFAAGLGSFSLHEGFISEAGCNIRLTSILTSAPLAVTPRQTDEPYANCLYFAKGICRECEKRCPADAIDENGHDKLKCYLYGQKIESELRPEFRKLLQNHYRRINGEDKWSYPVGCAFCQFGTPCTARNPTAPKQTRDRVDDEAGD